MSIDKVTIWFLRRFRYVKDLESRIELAKMFVREPFTYGVCTRDGLATATRDYIKSILPISIWLDFESNTDDSVPLGTIRVRMSAHS